MKDIRIPKMGMSTIEVDITAVHVANGQKVRPGDPLITVEGEKTSFDVEADVHGVIQDLGVAEGDERNVGDLVCRIVETGE